MDDASTTSTRAERVRALAADHLSPSSALAARASEILQEAAGEDPASLPALARSIVSAQPAMAALAVVANVALRALEALGVESVAPALLALRRGIDRDRREAAAALCERIDAPAPVVTTSASASVVEALQALCRADLLDGVVCSESRPLLEGTALARWLADQGYETTLVCDGALAEHLRPGALFLVGADAILPAGVANKRGTRLFATWARLAGARSYVLATRDKLYPPELAPLFSNPERPAGEILQHPPARLHVENRAFDVTARDSWTEILVGAKSLHEAESSGDHALADGLRPLLGQRLG
jgi:translation initiation factor 2B subunit (eIF-2B alpha/beta/delta family)